jgi:hypothetical protein
VATGLEDGPALRGHALRVEVALELCGKGQLAEEEAPCAPSKRVAGIVATRRAT